MIFIDTFSLRSHKNPASKMDKPKKCKIKTRRTSYYSTISSGNLKKRPNWDKFDPINQQVFDEEVASVSTMNSIPSQPRSMLNKIHKGASIKSMKAINTQNFNYKTSSKI